MADSDKVMRYEAFGPFPFSPDSENHRKALKQFWADRKEDGTTSGLCDAIGIYVWAFEKDGRHLPWNVGLTDRQGFKARFAQKELSTNHLQSKHPSASIHVYLLALKTKSGRFRKPIKAGRIRTNDWLETMLIGSALAVNPVLRNTAKVKRLGMVVEGYLNDQEEQRSESAKSFNALFKR